MNLLVTLIGLACFVAPGLTQRGVRQGQQCYTPDNDIGQCFTLSYCPSIANVLNIYPRNDAERYLRIAKRNCGNNNFRGDPVVCCGANQQYFTQPTTNTPVNPFFPTDPNTPTNNNNNQINPFFPTNTPIQPQPVPQRTTLPPIVINPTPFTTTTTTTSTTTTTTTAAPETTDGIENRSGKTCYGPDSRQGVCLPLAKCPPLLSPLQANPRDTSFIGFLKFSNEICSNEYSVVCCPNAVQIDKNKKVFPKNTNELPTKLPSMADGCGNVYRAFRKIVGGVPSKPGAWPWIALIGYDDGFSESPFKCGGTLITSRHILTAAHCIRSDLKFVRLGEHDLSTDTESQHVDVPVIKMLRHPGYNRTDGHNDIALLYLGQNVQFSEKITPICIPFDAELRSKDYIGFNPFVAGWGRTMEGGKSATVLQELQIPVYGNEVCKEAYRKEGRYISAQQFDKAVICAGDLSGGKDTCQGDSGGPLMFPEDYDNFKRFHLIGVVSYGIGCARPKIPGVYSRVSNFIEWIENGVADTSPF